MSYLKISSVIVATAEGCLAAVSEAREAIHGVIFGQEKIVDLALITILAGGHGLLVERRAYLELAGHTASLGDLGTDLDLGWRAHQAGRRVVAVPDAKVAVAPRPAEERPDAAHRAQARRVALARGSAWSLPFRAVGGAVVASLLALGLALIRRGNLAVEELAGVARIIAEGTGSTHQRAAVAAHDGDLRSAALDVVQLARRG